MYTRSNFTVISRRGLALLGVTLLGLAHVTASWAAGAPAGRPAPARQAESDHVVLLPMVVRAASQSTPPPTTTTSTPPPTQPAPAGSLPAELAGTWYSGQLLNLSLWDPVNKTWQDAGGLGHTYVFETNGRFVLASFLHIQSGLSCESRVWKYQTGVARVDGATLVLTPSINRTRTKIDCGSHTDTDLEGAHSPIRIPWALGEDGKGHTQLVLQEAQGETAYYKDGVGQQVLGAWQTGEAFSVGFYDPASQAWVEPSGAGEWYRFNADGTYQHGAVELLFSDNECKDAVMTYDAGVLTGSGSTVTLLPQFRVRRMVNLCAPDDGVDELLASGDEERWTWSVTEQPAGRTIDLIRVSTGFRQRILVREP